MNGTMKRCILRGMIGGVLFLLLFGVLACERVQKSEKTGLAVKGEGLSNIDKDIERLEQELKKQKDGTGAQINEPNNVSGTNAGTLENSVENAQKPVFSDEGTAKKITVTEGDLINLTVDAQDPDGDKLKVVFTTPLSSEGVWQTQIGDEGTYKASATVSDGTNTVVQDLLIAVLRKIVAPTISLNDVKAKEGETIVLQPKVEYRGDEAVVLSYSQPFDSNGSWSPDFKSAGSYPITVTAKAGVFVSEKKITVLVEDVNRAPVIAGLSEKITVKEGETVVIAPNVSDADDDPSTVTISDPVGSTGQWTTSYNDAGEYVVTVTAKDGKTTTTQTVTVIVTDVNRAPVIQDIRLG